MCGQRELPSFHLSSITRPELTSALNCSSISISVIYLLASHTNLLDADPILWFTMMLMPTGPPAMKLTALADVSGSTEMEKMSIAKFLCVSVPFS